MTSDSQYYKEMYHTMLRASEIAINWILDGKDPLWATHILMQATMECEDIYINEEIPSVETKEIYNLMYQQFLQGE